jgi:hypothetical protein
LPIYNYKCENCEREYVVMHKFSNKIETTADIAEYLKDSCECNCSVTRIIHLSFNSVDGDREKESRDKVTNVVVEMKEEIEESKKKMKEKSDGK